MPILAIGQSSSCTSPELDLITEVNGTKTDMASVEFVIVDRVTTPGTDIQVFPPSGRQTVDLTACPTGDKLATGHYVAKYTVPDGIALGTHAIKWFFKFLSTSTELSFVEEFEVISTAIGSSVGGYTTIDAMRAEGVPDTVTDQQLQTVILLATKMVDRFTQRFFLPKQLTFTLDGTSAKSIHLEQPIISISALSIFDEVQDLVDYKVYNRHLSENLLYPDDRENPRIEVAQDVESDLFFATQVRLSRTGARVFPRGQRNISVTGLFGYTDYDGSVTGKTPDLIAEATKLIAIREIPVKYTADATDEAFTSHRIIEMRTRDQQIKFGDPNKLGFQAPGPFTGDRRIDNILMMYAAPPRMRSV